jgi:hypothetical protein
MKRFYHVEHGIADQGTPMKRCASCGNEYVRNEVNFKYRRGRGWDKDCRRCSTLENAKAFHERH